MSDRVNALLVILGAATPCRPPAVSAQLLPLKGARQ
jgi:hypothetical protein